MSTWALRALERIHGHLGWLAAAALLHPVVLLWKRPGRRALLAATLATAFATLTGAIGLVLYPAYRARLKHQIFVAAPSVGWAFERKEHLAAGAVVLAWVGLAAHLASQRTQDTAARDRLGRVARASYTAAALLTVATAVLGVVVASYASF